jgi:signal transduction histidine kinase
LSLSKLESGKMQLQCEEMNLVEFVRNYIQSFESLAKHRNISLNFQAVEERIPVFIDKEKMYQVLNNLLSNAFKFTPEGGGIEVGVVSRQSSVVNQ